MRLASTCLKASIAWQVMATTGSGNRAIVSPAQAMANLSLTSRPSAQLCSNAKSEFVSVDHVCVCSLISRMGTSPLVSLGAQCMVDVKSSERAICLESFFVPAQLRPQSRRSKPVQQKHLRSRPSRLFDVHMP